MRSKWVVVVAARGLLVVSTQMVVAVETDGRGGRRHGHSAGGGGGHWTWSGGGDTVAVEMAIMAITVEIVVVVVIIKYWDKKWRGLTSGASQAGIMSVS